MKLTTPGILTTRVVVPTSVAGVLILLCWCLLTAQRVQRETPRFEQADDQDSTPLATLTRLSRAFDDGNLGQAGELCTFHGERSLNGLGHLWHIDNEHGPIIEAPNEWMALQKSREVIARLRRQVAAGLGQWTYRSDDEALLVIDNQGKGEESWPSYPDGFVYNVAFRRVGTRWKIDEIEVFLYFCDYR